MDTLRSVSHLQRELGDELFAALVNSDNTAAVREFAETLVASAVLSAEMTIGGRTYEILGFLKEGEESVRGDMMVSRAKEMNAYLGKEDCEFLLAHRGEIPPALRSKAVFVFPDWRDPSGRGRVAYVGWGDDGWYQDWDWLGRDWHGFVRLLRRKAA
jgi:hypothetical protein